MKKFVLTAINRAIIVLEKFKTLLAEKTESPNPYTSLSPINNSDKSKYYTEILSWAIENRKNQDIKNIALTGPYGSGKSSILKTFQKNYSAGKLKFLNISLATFKEEKSKRPYKKEENGYDEDLLRLIEISILQQIFYHEEDKKIPDSRFKKIKSFNWKQLASRGFGYLIFAISLFYQLYPTSLKRLFREIEIAPKLESAIHFSSLIIILLGIYLLIHKSVRLISSITINKLNIQNTEIGISDSINKSILNHHLDEILYFFSVRPYNVVIIEDLDRFQETEIFTKLREINLILNSSEKTKRKHIVFIYAVRDDIFIDKERTKFFDFIIPVIPTINSSNSSGKLLEKKNINQFNLSDAFIEDISFIIDDMRLLHNICNEFAIYKQQLAVNLNQDKLFAIVTYKNIYPNDFVGLSENRGVLFEAIHSKQKYINERINILEQEITDIKEQIKDLQLFQTKDIRDLRRLYVLKFIERLERFEKFIINKNAVTVEQLVQDENFQYLTNNSAQYQQYAYNIHNGRYESKVIDFKIKFADIEREVNPLNVYYEIEKNIVDVKSGKLNNLKISIQELEKEKVKVRGLKIEEIVQSIPDFNLEIKEGFNSSLIKALIKNGYISDDYLDYISIFHEGSITRTDYQFLIGVKNGETQRFDYGLIKTEKLISRINLADFTHESILNYNLLDFLLKHSDIYSMQLENVFSKLQDESEVSIGFVDGFYNASGNLEKFVNLLCSHWANIWDFTESNNAYADEQKNKVFVYILEYADIHSIKQIASQSNFVQKILEDSEFFGIISNVEKLKTIIKELRIKFIIINFSNSHVDLLEYIYRNRFYSLNPYMVKLIIQNFGVFNQVSYDNSNYSSVLESKCDDLIEHVNHSINIYVENIYLKINSNVNENEKTLITLINHAGLSFDKKVKIIDHVETKIFDINQIEDIKLYSVLLEENNVVAKWENLLTAFNVGNEIGDSMISFVNNTDNAKELSKSKIPTKVEEINVYGEFWKKLIEDGRIEDITYDLILKSGPWWYDDLAIENLSEKKVESLLKHNAIKPTPAGFDGIKQVYEKLSIKLVEKHKTKFLDILNQIYFDATDINSILKSTFFTNEEKSKILGACTEYEITVNTENVKLILKKLTTETGFSISTLLMDKILLNDKIHSMDRIELFYLKSVSIDQEKTKQFLNSLSEDYQAIADTNKRAVVEMNKLNVLFLNTLKEKGFISSYSETKLGLRINHKRKK